MQCRGELILSHAGIVITIIASLFALGGIARSVVEAAASHRWGTSLAQSLFLAIVGCLVYGSLVYQLARLGHLRRLMCHRAARETELHRFFHGPQASVVTVLVPSYKEDPQVVRRTLLSAALQDYPRRHVVLLIDDPPRPSYPADVELLAAARGLPEEIQEWLRKPAEHFAGALSGLVERLAQEPLELPGEIALLAQLYRDAATWFEEQEAGYRVTDHADALFVELTFRRPAAQYREKAARLDERTVAPGSLPPQELLEEYRRLAALFPGAPEFLRAQAV